MSGFLGGYWLSDARWMDIDVQNVTQKWQFHQMGIDDHVALVSFPSSVNELCSYPGSTVDEATCHAWDPQHLGVMKSSNFIQESKGSYYLRASSNNFFCIFYPLSNWHGPGKSHGLCLARDLEASRVSRRSKDTPTSCFPLAARDWCDFVWPWSFWSAKCVYIIVYIQERPTNQPVGGPLL